MLEIVLFDWQRLLSALSTALFIHAGMIAQAHA